MEQQKAYAIANELLQKKSTAELVKTMNKDDWHNLILTLNYDSGEREIAWLISQRELDVGTALRFAFESDLLDDLSSPPMSKDKFPDDSYYKIVLQAVENIIGGYYAKHEFAAFDDPEDILIFEKIRARVAKAGGPRFSIPQEVLAHSGTRQPQPRYSFDGNHHIIYDFNYWKSHIYGK